LQNKEDYEKMYLGEGKSDKGKSSNQLKLKSNPKNMQISEIDFEWKNNPFYRDDIKKKIKQSKKIYKPKPRKLKLQAITYSNENSFVMINDLILSEGEYVDGYRVEKIERTRVKLIKNGKAIYLSSK
jgi:hypothetical protein